MTELRLARAISMHGKNLPWYEDIEPVSFDSLTKKREQQERAEYNAYVIREVGPIKTPDQRTAEHLKGRLLTRKMITDFWVCIPQGTLIQHRGKVYTKHPERVDVLVEVKCLNNG